jgi:hypothetical protein
MSGYVPCASIDGVLLSIENCFCTMHVWLEAIFRLHAHLLDDCN